MKFFFGTQHNQVFISNFTDDVGVLWDSRDVNFVMKDIPAPPLIEILKQIVQEQKVDDILVDLERIATHVATERMKYDLNEILLDYTHVPNLASFLNKFLNPVAVYDSTLLPILKTHLKGQLLPQNAKSHLSPYVDTSSAQFDALYDFLEHRSIVDVFAMMGDAVYVLLRSMTPKVSSFIGQALHGLLLDISYAIVNDVDYGTADWNADVSRPMRRRVLAVVDSLFDRTVSQLGTVFTQKQLNTGYITKAGYSIIPSMIRETMLAQLTYDGAVASTIDSTMPAKNASEMPTIRFSVYGEELPLYPGIHTIGGPTATGKTTLTEYIREINPQLTTETVYVSEPHKPAYLALEGLNAAISYAVEESDAQMIFFDSMSELLVAMAKGQPLTSKGVSWKVREILGVMNTIAALCGKVFVLVFNVEESQTQIYTDLFRGVATIDYLPLNNSWEVLYREFEKAHRLEKRITRMEIASQLQLDRVTVDKIRSAKSSTFRHNTDYADFKFFKG